MWPTVVILVPPLVDDCSGFGQAAEDFAVEALVSELVVKALDVTVLPGGTRLDVERLDLVLLEPVLDDIRNELRSVVAANVLRGAALAHHPFEHLQHVLRANGPGDMRGQALPCVLVDQGQNAKRTALLRLIRHEVPAPHLVALRGAHSLHLCRPHAP